MRVSDKLHPDAAGQERLAQAVYEGILGAPDGYDADALTPVAEARLRSIDSAIADRPTTTQVTAAVGGLSEKIDLANLRGTSIPTPGPTAVVPKVDGARYTQTTTGRVWNAAQAGATENWVELQAAGAVPATTADTTLALARWRAGLLTRDTAACPIFGSGSSTTVGSLATTADNRYFNRFVAAIQAAYPLASGSAHPSTKMAADTANSTLGAGIQGVNYGKGGTESKDFLTSAEVAKMITQSSVAGVALHEIMVFSNDWSHGIPVAKAKANLAGWIAAIKDGYAAAGKRVVILLIGTYGRNLSTAIPTAPATAPVAT
ncbi:hypothetical protein C5E02_04825 [Rathayibacter rathayi]|uniref:SGNH hydrolase-type esterase domain-containing protein n=1 Tax=Rathayibacter rathayi TaxID=33887 RepID=A0ABD6WA36_RATRA|nr:hypothetical protein [Rathayibacter rathayi]PPF14456.1 hypothetical protein C5C04_06755 [Rathayibacter rathayi]PPG14989.1 hypothetical protein C5C11_03560 [Rathayibacter rathayi]PPG46970.1 hypothetical protein C5C20_01700 [Rathayibacter rathayi]PPH38886.1 hypothetical protein C5C28_01555 [Rathayibacter rathayi]PPH70674.1 hypothetical protein C5C45_00700 [Rathayibacter rathayi]